MKFGQTTQKIHVFGISNNIPELLRCCKTFSTQQIQMKFLLLSSATLLVKFQEMFEERNSSMSNFITAKVSVREGIVLMKKKSGLSGGCFKSSHFIWPTRS